jgi:hypothetical protein
MQPDNKSLVIGARSVVTKMPSSKESAKTAAINIDDIGAGAKDLFSGAMDGVGNTFSNYSRNAGGNPAKPVAATAGIAGKALGQAIPGALMGAGAGLAGSMTSEEQRKHKLRNMLMGALAGGGLTAGAGMAHSQYASPQR